MRHSLKDRIFSGFLSFLIAVVFVCASAVPDLFRQNVSADVLLAFDSASQVNYSTILGRASDFGIVADSIEQKGHMETNFAINKYIGVDQNFDVDLAGPGAVPFILAELDSGSNLKIGRNYHSDKEGDEKLSQSVTVYTTSEIADYDLFKPDPQEFVGTINYSVLSKTDVQSNVNKMIDRFKTQSSELLNKPSIDVSSLYTSSNHTLDLSNDCYKDSTIYVNVEAGSSLEASIASGDFVLKKNSSTVVVFNILSDSNITLNQYKVILTDKGNKEILSATDCKEAGEDSEHNKDVDSELARKIVWNVPNASFVKYQNTAGVFLLPNENTSSECTGSSAGWIGAAGKVTITAEWHFIFQDRNTDVNDSTTGSFHFAARKTFTDQFNGTNTKELKNIYAGEGQYKFSFVETYDNTYNTDSVKKDYGFVYTDENGKITFPVLSFNIADVDPAVPQKHYYVIKEVDSGSIPTGISISQGEIDIEVTVTNNNGVLSYSISSYKYLEAGKTGLISDPAPVTMSGTEYSLGGIYNLYTGDYGTLILDKNVSGDVPNQSTYKIAVKIGDAYVQGTNGSLSTTPYYFNVPLDGTTTITDLIPGTYTIEENEGDLPGYNLVNSTITVGTETTSTVTLAGGETKSAVITNEYQKVDLTGKGSISITKSVTGLTDSSKEYEVAVQAVNGKYVGNINGTSESDSIVWFKIKKGETLTFSGLDTTKTYNIYEKKSSAVVSGYDLVVTGFSTENEYSETYKIDAPISFASNNAVQVDLENKYTQQLGKLTIEKSFVKSDDSALVGSFGDVTFTITGPNSYSKTVKYSEFTDGKYEIPNLPVGTYTISESGADAAAPVGYVFDSMYLYSNYNWSAVSSANVAVVKGDNTAQLKNKYNAIQYQYITINKTVNGLSQDKTYEFALKNSEGKYFNNDTKEFQTGIVYTSVSVTNGSGSIDIGKGTDKNYIPAGTYTLIEKDANESGYTLQTTITDNGTITVGGNSPAYVTVSNKYISNDTSYKLTVSKNAVNAPYSNTEYEFYVKCMEDSTTEYYLKSNGDLTTNIDEKGIFKIKNGESQDIFINSNKTLEVSVVETSGSENSAYTLNTTYSDSVTFSSSDSNPNKTGKITITNTYEHNSSSGMLTITKTIDGEGLTYDEFKSALTFSVYNNNTQQYVDKDGNLTATKTLFTMAEAGFIKDSNGTYKKTFYDLPLGEYEVKEENTAVPNYNLVTTGTNQSITEGKATITLNSTSVAVDLKDVYTSNNNPAPTGTLTVNKEVTGATAPSGTTYYVVLSSGTGWADLLSTQDLIQARHIQLQRLILVVKQSLQRILLRQSMVIHGQRQALI